MISIISGKRQGGEIISLVWEGVMQLRVIQLAIMVLEKVLAFLVAVMVLLVFANVLTRYVFHVSIAWSEEIARFLFVFVVAIGSVVALERDEHLNIQIFGHFRNPRIAKFFKGVSLVLVIVALSILVFGGSQLVRIGMSHPAPVTGIPLGIVTLVVVVSMASMLIIAIMKLFNLIEGEK